MFTTNRQMRRHPEMFGITLYAPDGDTDDSGGGVAVLDKPSDTLDVDASADDTDADTEDGEVDNADVKAEDDKPKTPVLDPETEAILAARIEERDQQRARDAAETKRLNDEAAEEQAVTDAVRGHFTTARASIHEGLEALRVIGDDTIGLNPKQIDEFLKDFDKYEADAAASIGLRLRETLTRRAVAKLPEAEREAATKRLEAVDQADFLDAVVELNAPRASSLQELDLDGVIALSPKAKRQQAEAIKVAKNEATQAERKRLSELHGIDLDATDLSADSGNPPANNLTYDQYLKLDETKKAAFSKAHPEQFQAFLGIGKGK